MSNFIEKQFLDFQGLSQYDELIKKYIEETAGSNEVVQQLVQELAEVSNQTELQQQIINILNGGADVEGSVANQVKEAVDGIVDGAPEALDTLKEIAEWISEDETGSAALIARVSDNEDAIAALKAKDIELENAIDEVYTSMVAIPQEKIQSLFRKEIKVEDFNSVADAIANLNEDSKLILSADVVVDEEVYVPNGAFIDAQGATFTGPVTVEANATIENAVFAGPVSVEGAAR